MHIRSMALASVVIGFGCFIVACSDKGDELEAGETECDDGVDNDDDGDTDCADEDCCDESACNCGGPEDECDDGLDNDGDGLVDCEDDDCEPEPVCDFFEPTTLFVYGEVMIKDGALGGITDDGVAVDSYFMLYMVDNDAWEGTDDEDNACILYYLMDNSTATLSSDFSADFWQGWDIDTAAAHMGNAGRCDDLNPSVYGSGDISAYWAEYSWGMGFGPLSTDYRDALQESFGDTYTEYEDYWISGPVSYDYGGEPMLRELNYSLAYQVDDTGEIIVDGNGYLSYVDVSDASSAPDGYYRSYMARGLGL